MVQQLLDAGAIYAGKTNLDQFATGLVGTRSPQYGVCHNPIVPEFIAGGSSSGSAVAVATGEVTFALGTDTAGSGRVPAALCGIVGLKPTPGSCRPAASSPRWRRSTASRCSRRRCATAATVFGALSVAVVRRPRVASPRRVGVFDDLEWFGDDDAREQFDRALDHAPRSACTVTEVDAAPFRAAGALLYGSALVAERHTAFGAFAAAHPDAMDPAVAEIVRRAGRVPRAPTCSARSRPSPPCAS